MKTIELKEELYVEDLYASEDIHKSDERIIQLINVINNHIERGEIVCLDFKDFPKSYPFQSLGKMAFMVTRRWNYKQIVFCNMTMEILDCFSSSLSYVTEGKERLLCDLNRSKDVHK